MPMFKCESGGHRGPANKLVLKASLIPEAGQVIPNACPQCGKDVRIVPCNKHGGKTAIERDAGLQRKPFSLGIVGAK